MSRFAKYTFSLSLVFLVMGFARAEKIVHEEVKTLDMDGINRLAVDNTNGSVEVESWDKDYIEVRARKTIYTDDEDAGAEMLQNLKVNMEREDGVWYISTEKLRQGRRHGNGFWSWLFGSSGTGYSVSYEISIPRKLDLDIHSTNGSLKVYGGMGRMRLETTNGKIVAEDVRGSLRCKTTNGSITARLDKLFDDEMSFKSTNGSIKLYLPADANVDIKAKTTNGSIKCELPIEREDYSSSKKLSGSINKGGPLVYLKTTNGSIRIGEN